jgi:hypothetical protein
LRRRVELRREEDATTVQCEYGCCTPTGSSRFRWHHACLVCVPAGRTLPQQGTEGRQPLSQSTHADHKQKPPRRDQPRMHKSAPYQLIMDAARKPGLRRTVVAHLHSDVMYETHSLRRAANSTHGAHEYLLTRSHLRRPCQRSVPSKAHVSELLHQPGRAGEGAVRVRCAAARYR